jgi:hypothetical protein
MVPYESCNVQLLNYMRCNIRPTVAQSVKRLATVSKIEGGQCLSTGRVKNFHFSRASRPVVGPTHSPLQWVSGALSLRVNREEREADHLTETCVNGRENADLYIHSPIRLHGVVFN